MRVQDQGWTLHYTIGSILADAVKVGDIIDLPGDRGSVTVLGGKAPQRVKDTGSVQVSDSVTEGGLGARPGAVGCVWINDDSGGWSELS